MVDLTLDWAYGSLRMQDNGGSDTELVVDYEVRKFEGQWLLVFEQREQHAEVHTETMTDTIYQNERRASPFSSYNGASLDPTDPPHFSDQAGHPVDPQVHSMPSVCLT